MQPTVWQKLTNLTGSEDVKQEMSKKYRNTILKLVTSNKKTFYAKYSGVTRNGLHLFHDLHDNEIKIAPDTDVDVRIWYPKRGLYNIEYNGINRFVYFSRTANRQYRRGINQDNSRLYDPLHRLFEFQPDIFGIQQLKQIADNTREYRHLDEVLPKLLDPDNNTVGYAFNNRWGVSGPVTANKDMCHLWLHQYIVADIQDNNITFENPIFIQELLDEKGTNWFGGYHIK